MKKIAILTLTSYNQGNRLQNYALQTILERMGYKVATLQRNRLNYVNRIKSIIRNLIIKDQYTCFNKFNRLIKWSRLVVSSEFVSEQLRSKYDYIIVGSDQIWNPKIDNCTDCVYLPEIPSSKKIAYAVSFGTTDFSSSEIERMAPLIKGFKNISCREEAGTKFINEVIYARAITVLDPVMLISKEEWRSFERKPKFITNNKYIFRYVLGDYKYDKLAEKIGMKLNAEIVDPRGGNIVIDPREFLYLINHAEFVLTDSFHGAVFSVMFGRNLFITERRDEKEDMSCRLDTLCNLFGLNQVRISYEMENEALHNFSKAEELYNRSKVDAIIESRKKESLAFLKKSLV